LFPHEYKHIITYFDSYFCRTDKQTSLLLQGDIQSGKTAVMILTALCYLTSNSDVVVVLRNSLDDVTQFTERFETYVSAFKSIKYSDQRFVIAPRNKKAPAHPCVFVVNYMKMNLKKLHSKLAARNSKTSAMIIDEADLRTNDAEFNLLRKRMNICLFVSATVQDILTTNWNIRCFDVLRLAQNPSYRGLEDLKIITHTLVDADDLFWTLCDIAIDQECKLIRPEHPKIVLLNVDRKISAMTDIYQQLTANSFKLNCLDCHSALPKEMQDVCSILYTGNGIRLYHSSLGEIVKTNILLKEVLLWLAQTGGANRFPNIVIVSGDMARRGINFACHDPLDQNNSWHLTHQILMGRDNSTCAMVVQACRILGNHGDNIPLKLYCSESTKDKIIKSYRLSEAVTGIFSDRDNKFCRDKTIFTKEACAALPICRADRPDKYLRKGVRTAFRWVNRGEETIFDAPAQQGIVNLQVMESLFEKWGREKHLQVSKFLHSIDPYKAYTVKEISREFPYVQLGHYFGEGSKYGKGQIFTRCLDVIQVAPDLVCLFQKYLKQ
jgi:hypothetical protein